MKRIFLMLSLCVSVLLCASAREMVYHVGPFDKLSQMGDIDIVYKNVPDSAGMAVYHSDTDFSEAIEITNNKGKLSVKEIPNHDLGKIPVLHVYSEYLSQVKSEGNSTVEARLSTTTPVFSVNLVGNGRIICEGVKAPRVSASITTGNGTVALRGKCQEASFKLTGSGVIQADGLVADDVKCTVLGTGSIGCDAVKSLDVRGVGTTKIYYKGDPSIKKVGGAKISPLQEVSVEELQPRSYEDDEPTEVSSEEEDEDDETDDELDESEEEEEETED